MKALSDFVKNGADVQATIKRPVKPKKRFEEVKLRKNSDLGFAYLKELQALGISRFTVQKAALDFDALGLKDKWDVETENGFHKALGDLFGKHQFHLETVKIGGKKNYVVPEDGDSFWSNYESLLSR